jgi:hypothetical protein
MSSDKLTSAVSTIRYGFPCSHVLRVTNELQLDMIKIQHWKIYAAHYNDDSSRIGMELKRIQLAYRHYEGMVVPISGDLLSRLRKPNFDGVFPYLYDGTTKEDYNLALSVETSNCSVTFSKIFSTKHNIDNDKIEWIEQELAVEKEDQTECFTCEFTADDVDNVALRTPQISKQISLEQELAGEKKDQTEYFTCEFTADDADNVTLQTPKKSKHMSLDKETVCVEMEMRRCQGNSLFLSPTHESCTIVLRKHQKILKHYIQQKV